MNSEHFAVFINVRQVKGWYFTPENTAHLQRLFPQAKITVCASEEEFVRVLPTATIALVWHFRQEWFKFASNLRCLSTPAAGKDVLGVTDFPENLLTLNGSFHGELMAETAVGAVLAMTRGLLPAVTTFKDNPWPRHELGEIQRPLRGSRIVIVGFGNIGQRIGKMLKPFDVTIRGMRRNLNSPRPDWFTDGDAIISPQQLDDELPLADHVVIVLPGDSSTDNFLDAERVALLPAHATLTNLGRGNCLDLEALDSALRQGKLAGACLDVFPQEPLPADSPLRSCPNLWLFPHSSAISPNYLDLYLEDLARKLNNHEFITIH